MKKIILGVMAILLLTACSKEEGNQPPLDLPIVDVPNSEIWYKTTDSQPLILPQGNSIFISYGLAVNMIEHVYENGIGKLIFDGNVTEIHGAFAECSSLKEVWLPNGISLIGSFTFKNCRQLTQVRIPDNVSSIESFAFYGCCSLPDVTIPDAVTLIGYAAFQGCGALNSITIPEGVTTIGYGAFCDCAQLKEIYCRPITPPFIDTNYSSANNYDNILDSDIPVYVPENSVEEYASRRWWKSLSLVGYQYQQ